MRELERLEGEDTLLNFVRQMWHVTDPATPFIDGWAVGAICEHLQAVTSGEIKRLCMNVCPGFNKALDVNTPIMTTWGWKNHGDLRPGDFIYGADGLPKRVTANMPHVEEESYWVEFDDGAAVVAGAGHLWEVDRDHPYADHGQRIRKKAVVTTTDLIWSVPGRSTQRPDRIAIAAPLNSPPKRLLIDPYVLGAWLGDGATDSGVLYAAEQDIEHFSKLGRISLTKKDPAGKKQDFHRINIEGLQTKLRLLGILGHKHIPDDYLEASVEQRWELLRGIMDTDGCATKPGNCTVTSKLEHLARQYLTLACSLGLKATLRSDFNKLNGKIYGPYYHVSFMAPPGSRIFNLPRKRDNTVFAQNERSRHRYVKYVKALGPRTVNCISVEGEIYLAGERFVATHNSTSANVFWPAWEWGPKRRPHERYITASYSQHLTIRDNIRFRRVINSDLYRLLWGDVFGQDMANVIKVENDKTGWKLATSVGGIGTGERGTRVIIDDGNSVMEAESEAVRNSTNMWFREVMPDRLGNMATGAIVNIQQRTHENDISGVIMANDLGYETLVIPMEFDPDRRFYTSIGWTDPRTQPKELAWPERFPAEVCESLKTTKGPYAWAGQYQQSPTPRGGGIIKREWWKLYPPEGEAFDDHGKPLKALFYPPMDYVVLSLDSAYGEKEENDYSAVTVWGVWSDKGRPRVLLMEAWKDRIEINKLVRRVMKTAEKRQIDALLIENKASGPSVYQELRRLCEDGDFQLIKITPDKDKVARTHAAVSVFAGGLVYAPDREWANDVIDNVSVFPKGEHDDLHDCTLQAINYLRKMGLLKLDSESHRQSWEDAMAQPESIPLYDVVTE